MNRKVGRPPVENPKTERIFIRVDATEKKQIMDFCEEAKVTCLELIRRGMKATKK
jgi:hypothetical protein